MSEMSYKYYHRFERSDAQLLEDALKRAYPAPKESERRFVDLLARLREEERRHPSD